MPDRTQTVSNAFVYYQAWYKRCNACGHRLQTTDERQRKCPACGKLRLAKTGRLKLVVGNLSVTS